MTQPHNIRLLYLTAEAWPTFRVDVSVLFGKYLPRLGVVSDLMTEYAVDELPGKQWTGGEQILFNVPRSRGLYYFVKTWFLLVGLMRANASHYDAIQVRDMPVIALAALIAARIKGLSFFYWMSFPQSEGQIFRAKARGPKAGLRYWFPLIQGTVGRWVLYKLVLQHADHVFVQSDQMVEDVIAHDIQRSKITPVPMGIDIEELNTQNITSVNDVRLSDKRISVYVGTLDRARNIDILLEMLVIVRRSLPNFILVLVGDTEDTDHKKWLENEARRLGVSDVVIWTGWIPILKAWSYVKAAEVGLSPFPRGFLLDSASPTKAVEYLALGIPVVANDNPDQARLIAASGAGLCVSLTAENFASSVIELLSDPIRCRSMGRLGKDFIARTRGYDRLAVAVKQAYIDALDSVEAKK